MIGLHLMSKSLAQKIGVTLHKLCPEELANNAEKDGTTTLTLASRKTSGLMMRILPSLRPTKNMEINGPK
tara:strand:+ start:897 stop:1106 length:210 start_codon:yes stop_codon:yes gene_type:complete